MADQPHDVAYPIAVGHRRELKPLTLRFGLLTVVAALVGAVVFRAAVMAAANAMAQAQSQDSGDWSGLGTALLGVAVGFFGGYATAVVVALIVARSRVGGRRFAVYFSAVYLVCLVIDAVNRWSGYLVVELGDHYIVVSSFVTLALPFTLPLALSRLIRWRTVALLAGVGVLLAVVAALLEGPLARAEQSEHDAAYSGPSFAPSTSPGSPVDGYLLAHVELPDEYDDHEGAVGVSLTYRKPAADGFDDYFYIEFSADDSAMHCGDRDDSCPEVGTALGSTVYAESANVYLVAVDGGMVAIRGDLDGDEVLAVLDDLHAADIDELGSLSTD